MTNSDTALDTEGEPVIEPEAEDATEDATEDDTDVVELAADNDEQGDEDQVDAEADAEIEEGLSLDDIESPELRENVRLVEALIFASASAVTERSIAERLGEGVDIPSLLGHVKALYAGRGVELTRAGNRWFFRTAPDLGERLKLEKMVPRKLSRAGTETLAIISYHQPVTRSEIEEIRGVVISKGTIDILLEEGWIKPKGRRHTPGRPVTWGTSDAFLDHFGLESLNDLPGIDELKAAGLLDSRQGLAAYNARAEQGETLLFDTDESDEVPEPLVDEDAPLGGEGDISTEDALAETFEDEDGSAENTAEDVSESATENASEGEAESGDESDAEDVSDVSDDESEASDDHDEHDPQDTEQDTEQDEESTEPRGE